MRRFRKGVFIFLACFSSSALLFWARPGSAAVMSDYCQVPPFVVFSDATLVAMAALRPTTPEEMGQVSGVGAHKLGHRPARVRP